MSRRKPNSSQLAIVNRNGEANGRPMTKRRLDFGERWSYAPALEANSYIKLRNRYQLFINGRFVPPKSGDYFYETGIRIGMKPAGGIRTAKEALAYLVMVKETLGDDWLTSALFRFGASTLLNDVLMQLVKVADGNYQSADYFSLP